MTALKRGELAAALARWSPDLRLLLLAGPDDSGVRASAAEAQRALTDPADLMAVVDLAAEQLAAAPGRLADEAAAVPMFGGRTLIRVTGAGDGCVEAVELLLAAPVAGNPVVMQAGDLPKTSALRRLAEGSAVALAILHYPLDARDAQRWVADEARRRGLRLEAGVAEALLQSAGGDTGVVGQELEKFALYLDADPERPQRLEPGHLAELGVDSLEEDVGALVAALVGGDARGYARQIGQLQAAGASAIPALRAVARKLMQLMELRAAVDEGVAADEAVRAMRPPVFWREQKPLAAAVRRWPPARIRAGLAAMLAGERAIKQAGGPGDIAGWQALLGLAVPGPERGRLGEQRPSA